jgi:hypothetical protein
MKTRRTKELMTLRLEKTIEQYLLILATGGKSPCSLQANFTPL